MQLNVKNKEVVALAEEVAAMAGETKTEAIRQALLARRRRLMRRAANKKGDAADVLAWLESEVWARAPADRRGWGLSGADGDERPG